MICLFIFFIAQNDWSTEANNFFEELAQGQIIYASIIGYVENDVPVVDLFKLEGTNVSLELCFDFMF